MTKRDIKTIVAQCQKGLPYQNALASIVYLAAPDITVKESAAIISAVTLFNELYWPNKENTK